MDNEAQQILPPHCLLQTYQIQKTNQMNSIQTIIANPNYQPKEGIIK